MAQLAQCGRLDLPNALARHADLAANRGERFVRVVGESETTLDHTPLARRERQQRVADLIGQQALLGRHLEARRVLVGHHVRQSGVLVLADEPVERDRLRDDLVQLADAFGRDLQRRADFLVRRLAPQLLVELAEMRAMRLTTSYRWTGMRMVRASSAIARETA